MARSPQARMPLTLWLLTIALATAPPSEDDGNQLTHCEAQYAEEPQGWNSCACFYHLGRQPGMRAAMRDRLQTLRDEAPERPCPRFYLASMLFEDGEDPSDAFARAAALYTARGELQGAYYAHSSLGRWYRGRARFDEALGETAKALAAARQLGDQRLVIATEVEHLKLAESRGKDLAKIEARLAILETSANLEDHPALVLTIDDLLAKTRLRLGDLARAQIAFDRLAQRFEQRGDHYAEATARFHAALCLLPSLPSAAMRAEAIERLTAALSVAESAGNLRTSVAILHKLGELDRSELGKATLYRSVELARQLAEPSVLYGPLLAWAERIAFEQPEEVARLLREADAARPREATASLLAAGWLNRLRIAWYTAPPDDALARSLLVLEEIEHLRSAQIVARAEYFSLWLPAHQWLAGRLLAQAAGWPDGVRSSEQASVASLAAERVPVVEDRWLESAFSVIERMRARILLEASDPLESAPLESSFANLSRVRAQLNRGEAMLSFQLAPWRSFYDRFEGGAWLITIEPEQTRLYTLPGPVHLEPAISHFEGLFAARNGGEKAASSVLYEQLLAPALADLPPTSQHLIVIADGALHRLPLAALTSASPLPWLASTQLSSAPSASLWSRWRDRSDPLIARLPALIFAAPELAATTAPSPGQGDLVGNGSAGQKSKTAFRDQAWRPLPAARREGRRIRRQLGRHSRLLVGDLASEAAIKRVDAGGYSVLHFATHALVNEQRGGRSGILLAPGSETEDGLLEPHEIRQLDLSGTVVVLAACRSGGGRLLHGEGFLSLARDFFQSGARTVIASLWPLRDDDSEHFFRQFYHHIRKGQDVATAVAAAQGAVRKAGAPAAAWAGVVVLGEGTVVPFPDGLDGTVGSWLGSGPRVWLACSFAAVLLVAAVVAARRREKRER